MPDTTDDTTARLPARERILRATLEVIAAEGLDAVTHRAVAARAEVSPGSTTHHFSSRDDLVREAFRSYLRVGERRIRALVVERPEPGEPALDALRSALVTIVSGDFTEGLLRAEYELLLYATADTELAAEVRSWDTAVVGVVAQALEAAGAVRPTAGAWAVLNLVRGYELERLADPSLPIGEFAARLDVVLAGAIGTGDPG